MIRTNWTGLAALVIGTACAVAQSSSTSTLALTGGRAQAGSSSGLELRNLDTSANACTDFYQFACGGWIAEHPIPVDKQRSGRFGELQDQVAWRLRQILERPAPRGDAGRQQIHDYYAACMDERGIEARGLVALQAEMSRIDAIDRKDALWAAVAHLHGIGVPALFRFGSQPDRRNSTLQVAAVSEGGIALPDRDYYLKSDARSRDFRQKYEQHVRKMLTLLGDTPDRAASGAAVVVAFETRLADATLDRTARRDPTTTDHMMSAADWRALAPGIGWTPYLGEAAAPAFDRINVAVPEALQALDKLIASTPLDDIKTYLRWQLVHASVAALPQAFGDADFDYFSRTLSGQPEPQPRWRRCVTQTDDRLGEVLGKVFVEEAFSPRAKQSTIQMVREIKAAMKQDIEAATWMTEETKRAAEVKLAAVVDRIGYPDKWKDYSSVQISSTDALGNRQRIALFDRQRTLDRIGKPIDQSEWTMTPPTVNAFYRSARNDINFPAGILQAPFYAEGRDPALNYGGIGAVVGHELTHGFDDQGRKFDAQGNLRNWWTDADAKAYEARATCVANQYSEYVVAGDTHLNGRLTLGENTADNGGLRLALMAYLAGPGPTATVVDGFTPEQRFFLGYAHIWCGEGRPEYERRQAATNPHATGRYRVNGVLSNMPEFQKAFSCKADAPMVRQNQCRVW